MGGFYGSVQVRTTDRPAVKAAAELVAAARKIHCLIGPEINGWIGIYPEGHGQDDTVGGDIAKHLDADVLHLMVHDDDVLAYRLWRKHELVDSYCSSLEYFEDDRVAEDELKGGDAEQFRPIIGDQVELLSSILDPDQSSTFESDRLQQVAELLGISNARTAFEYLQDGARKGINGWRKFGEIPVSKSKAEALQRKVERDCVKARKKALGDAGLLLHFDERLRHIVEAFAFSGGVFVMCHAIIVGQSEMSFWTAPFQRPQPLPAGLKNVRSAKGSNSGSRIAIGTEASIRVFDVSAAGWNLILEIAKSDLSGLEAVSQCGQFIAYSAHRDLTVAQLPDGFRLCEVPAAMTRCVNFHPFQKWLATCGVEFRLVNLEDGPSQRKIHIITSERTRIGNFPVGEHVNFAGFSRDGRWLWCGTDRGLRVYNWADFPRRHGATASAPIWGHDAPARKSGIPCPGINAVVEEVDRPGIVFGGWSGQLMRLDLETGKVKKLVDLAGSGGVYSLHMSPDGKTLTACARFTKDLCTGDQRRRDSWMCEIWSYPAIRDGAVADA